MILLTFLTICEALRWSQTGEPLKKAERKEAKLERKLEKSQARVNDPSLRRQLKVGTWSHKLPFDEGTVGRSKCLLRSAEQKKCCDNTEVCPGCDPLLLARGYSCEEQVTIRYTTQGWGDPNWRKPDYCHCSSSYG